LKGRWADRLSIYKAVTSQASISSHANEPHASITRSSGIMLWAEKPEGMLKWQPAVALAHFWRPIS